MDIRRVGGQIALLVLSLLGIGISIYLTVVHYDNAPLVCSASGIVDCARVLSSPYSVVPGTTSIPISVPGLGWCVIMAALAIGAWRIWPERRSLLIAELVWALSGLVTVLYLVYVELVRLHTICAWCTALHVVILLMFLFTILQIQRPEPEAELEPEEEKPSVAAKRG